jgi:hemerythrin-like domain-containing protein
MKPTHALREHHNHLMLEIQSFEQIVEKLPYLIPEELKRTVEEQVAFLKKEIIPHAASEEKYLYKEVDYLTCRHEVKTSATMEIDHEYIGAYIERLADLAAKINPKTVPEFQRVTWELGAILKLHFDKEERVYLPLLDSNYTEEEVNQRIVEKMEQLEEEMNAKVHSEYYETELN